MGWAKRNRFLVSLGYKNLSRYRKRTLVTASAIALGVMMFVGLDSMFQDFFADSDRNYAQYEVGSASMVAKGYWKEKSRYPLEPLIQAPRRALEVLEAAGFQAAPLLEFRGELNVQYDPYPEDGTVQVLLRGIDTLRDPGVFKIAESVEQGRFLQAGEEGALISSWLADRLGAELGFPITIKTRTREGYHQVMDLLIRGIYRTPNPMVDRSTIFLPLEIADYYLQMGGAVSRIALSLPEPLPGKADLRGLRETVASLREAEDLEVLDFATLTEEFAEIKDATNGFSQLMLLLLALIAMVGISNTMLMAVMEREGELGMMRAIGFRDREIKVLFALEAAGIGLLGALGGVVLSTGFVWFLVNHGIDYRPLMSGFELDYRWSGILRGVWNLHTMAGATFFAALVASLVSFFPTRRMLKTGVAENLRSAKK